MGKVDLGDANSNQVQQTGITGSRSEQVILAGSLGRTNHKYYCFTQGAESHRAGILGMSPCGGAYPASQINFTGAISIETNSSPAVTSMYLDFIPGEISSISITKVVSPMMLAPSTELAREIEICSVFLGKKIFRGNCFM